MEYTIDWMEAKYLADRLEKGLLSSEAVSQRLHKALRNGDSELYLTMKLSQAIVQFNKKAKGLRNED